MMFFYSLVVLGVTVHGFTSPISELHLKQKSIYLQKALRSESDGASSNDSSDDSSTIFYNDFEDFGYATTDPSTLNLSQLLNQRSRELRLDGRRLLKNWRNGKSKSYGAFSINERYLVESDDELPFDWVRRLDIGKYPRVACGSAHGSIFLADASAKEILAEARGVHYSQHSDDHVNCLDEKLRQYIYGDYDGGGVLDIAMFGKRIIASAGREGGVKIFRYIEGDNELLYEGDVHALIRKMPGALPIVVTCIKFDSTGRLYIGCSDGFLRIVTFSESFLANNSPLDEMEVLVIPPPIQPYPILSLDISEELSMVVVAYASGNVCVYALQDNENGELQGNVAGVWNPFAKSEKSHARSVTFASTERRGITRHAVVVGGGNGEVWICDLDPLSDTLFDKDDAEQIERHVGPVVSLASRPGGIIISVGHDGIMRIMHAWLSINKNSTDMDRPLRKASLLYGIAGLKVWVGSVCVDKEGKRLVSDGFDDAVVIHDFSAPDNDEFSDSYDEEY